MRNIAFFIGLALNCVIAGFSASQGNIAKTIFHSTLVLSLVLAGIFTE